MFRIGFDIGSTTAKMVVLDENGNIVFSKYERHNAKVKETVISFLKELLSQVGDEEISIRITGSIGMGVSEKCAISFVQEVVAAGVFDTLKSMLPPPFLLYFSTTRYNTPRLELYSNSTAFFKNLPK